jgi:seryl-tRNA synthetase
MVLDIDLFRQETGHDPQVIRDSQKKRYKRVELVDEVIQHDNAWRTARFQTDQWNKIKNLCGRTIGKKIQAKENEGDAEGLPDDFEISFETINAEVLTKLTIKQIKRVSLAIDVKITKTEVEMIKYENDRNAALREIGNIVHESVPVSDNEVKTSFDLVLMKRKKCFFRIIILPNELTVMLKHEKHILILI